MYFLILTLLVTVSARDISKPGHYYEQPHHGRFDRQFVAPVETNQRNYNVNYDSQNGQAYFNHEQLNANYRELGINQRNENANFHTQNRQDKFGREQFNANHNRQFETSQRNDNGNYNNQNEHVNLNNKEFNANNNRELIANDRNRNVPYVNQERSHDNTGSINVNPAFDRQENQNRNIHAGNDGNNEYRNRDDSNQNQRDKYNDNIQQVRRQQDEMVFGDSNGKTHQGANQENTPVNQSNGDIISFLGKINNSTNRNEDRYNQNTNQRNQSSFKSNTKDAPKTTIDNEVTINPENTEGEKENRGLDKEKWSWGVVETTTMAPLVTLDDRAAFSGDKCATGMVRVFGKCVEED